jgi:hypothetical protein
VPGAKDLFARLEEEEAQHEARVRLLAARYRHDSRLVSLPPSPAALDVILEDAEEVLRAIREGRFAQGFEEVRVNLAALEERFALAHAEIIAGEGHPDLRDFFRKLAAQDRGHRDLLQGGQSDRRGTTPASEPDRTQARRGPWRGR